MERAGRHAPGAVLVGALTVFIAGAAIGFLAPSLRDAPPFVTEDVVAVADAIAGNPTAWQWANGLIIIATLVTTLALVPIGLRLRAGPWGVLGIVGFALAAVFEVLGRMLAIRVSTWAAPRYDDAAVVTVSEAFDRFDDALGYVAWILAFVAVVFFGFAMRRGGGDDGLGWLFVAIGSVGVVLAVLGLVIPLFVFLATAAIGIASWRVSPAPDPSP